MAKLLASDLLEFQRAKKELGLRKYEFLGLLETFTQYCHIHTESFDGVVFQPGDIAEVAEYEGDSALLEDVLLKHGWIERQPDEGFKIADYKNNIPDFVRKRLSVRRGGTIPEKGRSNSGTIPEKGRNNSGKTPEQFHDVSGQEEKRNDRRETIESNRSARAATDPIKKADSLPVESSESRFIDRETEEQNRQKFVAVIDSLTEGGAM